MSALDGNANVFGIAAVLGRCGQRLRPGTAALPGVVLAMFLSAWMAHAADPYDAWAAGQPAEAAQQLEQRATRWHEHHDAGLAWAAAQQPARAAACLLRAHRLAPAQAAPLEALAVLGQPLPNRWVAWLGPIAWPGLGWSAIACAVLAGAMLGVGCWRRRRLLLPLGGAVVLIAAPGVVATLHDAQTPFAAVAVDTWLVDAARTPISAVPAGTIIERQPGDAWAGQVLVRLRDGQRGFIAASELLP